jgi:hypothetical protein
MVRREHDVSMAHETAGQRGCGGIGYPTSLASGSSARGGIPNSARGLGPGKLGPDDDGQAGPAGRVVNENKQSKHQDPNLAEWYRASLHNANTEPDEETMLDDSPDPPDERWRPIEETSP